MSNRLEGKVALVTACTRGIGRAIADLFVDEGAKVYYACRNMETGKAAVEAARARGGQAELVYFEAHDPATHRSMIDECIAKEGRLDVLVNNFGESNPRKDLDITKCTYKEFEKTVCVDLSTVFNACQEALNKAMIKQHSGSIINIGSVIGEGSMIDMGAVLGGRATVGKNCHIGAGTVLAGVVEPASATPVIIEDDVMIGANAVVLEGVHVGKGAVVAAGAVCVEDVPAGAVVAGVPARVIKMRDEKTDSKTGLEEGLRQL